MSRMSMRDQATSSRTASPRASGDVTTPPTPGTPRGDLLALLQPDFLSLPPDSQLSDATVAAMLADNPADTMAKMHILFCTPPGPFYCEAERVVWSAQHPWCNPLIAVPPVTIPRFTDEVTRQAFIDTHPTCPTPPPVLSDHTCTPGDPTCDPRAVVPASGPGIGMFLAGVAALGLGWWLYESGKAARGNPRETAGLFFLNREPLNKGGYTRLGRYFGVGAPLYRWTVDWPDGGSEDGYVRGATREAAMAKVREKHPGAKFVSK